MKTTDFPAGVGCTATRRIDAVEGTFHSYIRESKLPCYSHEVMQVCVYDSGTTIENLWSYHRTFEEAEDMIRLHAAKARGESYELNLVRDDNHGNEWTERAAEIEARKRTSRDRSTGRKWRAAPSFKSNRGRYILEGILAA